MSVGATAAVAFVIALATVLLLTPLSIRFALRTNFVDRPRGYKQHSRPTPYLGGLALVGGFTATLLVLGDVGRFWPAGVCVLALLAVGTVDDRSGLGPWLRVAAEAVAGLVLWQAGLGWSVFGADGVNLVMTVIWVVAVVNAFNLMDNLDGACATIGTITGATAGALALAEGSGSLAAMAFGACGACLGFLRFNLGGPARIFLGDGGSMPLGLIAALLTMDVASRGWPADNTAGLVGALLVGSVLLDTTLVILSRLRRSAPLFSGGRDHLTHRLLEFLNSAPRVAAVLAAGQLVLSAGAVAGYWLGDEFVIAVAATAAMAGLVVIAVLERIWSTQQAGGPEWASASRLDVASAPVGD